MTCNSLSYFSADNELDHQDDKGFKDNGLAVSSTYWVEDEVAKVGRGSRTLSG